jgi:hypothetical protein
MATKDVQNHLNSRMRQAIPSRNRGCRPDLNLQTLGDLLERFAPEGYEDGEGGFGTITFDLETLLIRVEHNWYETVSHPDEPREI